MLLSMTTFCSLAKKQIPTPYLQLKDVIFTSLHSSRQGYGRTQSSASEPSQPHS